MYDQLNKDIRIMNEGEYIINKKSASNYLILLSSLSFSPNFYFKYDKFPT